jgi:uncharacterized membrane protein YidH (DUF202 family)
MIDTRLGVDRVDPRTGRGMDVAWAVPEAMDVCFDEEVVAERRRRTRIRKSKTEFSTSTWMRRSARRSTSADGSSSTSISLAWPGTPASLEERVSSREPTRTCWSSSAGRRPRTAAHDLRHRRVSPLHLPRDAVGADRRARRPAQPERDREHVHARSSRRPSSTTGGCSPDVPNRWPMVLYPSTGQTVLDAAMAQPQPLRGSEHTDAADEAPPVPTSPSDLDQTRRTSMAVERTWLAWWRTALGASAGALAVGRFAPELLDVAAWPYILLGCGYASLAVGLLIVGAQRQRKLEHALRTGGHVRCGSAPSGSSPSAASRSPS